MAALKDKGDLAGVVTEYKEWIRQEPKSGEVHASLARLLAAGPEGVRDGRLAVELATRACELGDWKNVQWIEILAASYAEAGKFDKAIENQKKVLALTSPAAPGAKEVQQRLDLYTRKTPYRDPVLPPAKPRKHAPPPSEGKR